MKRESTTVFKRFDKVLPPPGLDQWDPNDVRNAISVFKQIEGSACDAIIHLAAISGINACEEDPIEAYSTNITGTFNVVDMAKRFDIPLVFASSFAAQNPINIYGATKKIAEKIVLDGGGTVLRFANVYGGPNYLEKKNSVIAYLMKCKENEEVPTIHDEGMHARDFIHVYDICDALMHALNVEPGIYTVCTGKSTFVKEIVEHL